MNKKLALIVFITLILITFFFISKLIGDENYDTKQHTDSTSDENDLKTQCLNLIKNSIVGEWKYLGGEIKDSPAIVIFENNSFKFTYNDSYVVGEGMWEYNSEENSLRLKFLKYDNLWISLLDSDLSSYSNIVSYSSEDKYLELKILYMTDPATGEFTKCEEDRFALDFLNLFIYKQLND